MTRASSEHQPGCRLRTKLSQALSSATSPSALELTHPQQVCRGRGCRRCLGDTESFQHGWPPSPVPLAGLLVLTAPT